MPQIGHAPGFGSLTWGCMAQVYTAAGFGAYADVADTDGTTYFMIHIR
ncbi:hypothetical protein BSU04_14435 [Caballeronia sordidicola]|uniref:Uncharacterized protein n=1 Tax=Caballeronia sordidicola TaxID=196367 RepID=A0A226X395_CABSO|nr:hypothetical protein BSU04_14435 [Caballeronia sordidicola]